MPPAPTELSKKYSDYIATFGITMDFGAELKRAESLAADIRASRDPLAGVTGDVHLAYRSDLDGMLLPYRIYVPTAYNRARKYPLIIFLHGANCDENTFMLGGALQRAAEDRGYFVASINGRGPFSFYRKENGAEKDLFDVMALMQKYCNGDAESIFLTGHSMGAMGTWRIGLEFRDRFAALAPMAGTRESPDLEEKLATGRKIPILITCGGKDTAIPPEPGIKVYRKLDPKRFTAMGMSCGGLQALEVSPDSRVTTSVIMNSGVLSTTKGEPAMPVNVSKEILKKLHAPTIYVLGGKKDIAYPNGSDDFARIDTVPVAMANLEVGHGGTYSQPNGGEFGRVAVAWLKWRLKGDMEARKMYAGPSCGLCSDPNWKLEKKKFR